MDIEQLNELSIFALRELARRTGVNSPTSKKKDQLIEEIIAITNGEKKPHIPKTKQGRPPKNFGYDFNAFKSNSLSKPNFSNSKILVLNQEVKPFKTTDVNNIIGVVEIMQNNSAFLWVNNVADYCCLFVQPSLVDKWNLKSGDKVMCEYVEKDDQTIITDILTINGYPALKYNKQRLNYYEIPHVLNSEVIEQINSEFVNLKINKGENIFVYPEELNSQKIISILNSCDVKNKIYINVSIVEKNKHILNSIQNAELYVSKLTDSLETSRRIVTLAIERAMRLIELGQDVLVVVDDALSLVGVDMQDLSIIKKLVSITKNAENGSITLIAVSDENKIINQIEKLADKKIKI